jgi:hypothetical protein
MNIDNFIQKLRTTKDQILTNSEESLSSEKDFARKKEIDSSKDVLNLKKNQISKELPNLKNTLLNSKISKATRSKMIDWMIEIYINILSKDFDIEIIFRSIQIMDLYIKKEKKTLINKDIHLIGITSLYLACKLNPKIYLFVQIIPIISHNRFTLAHCEKLELEILKTLDFNINQPNFYDLLNYYFELFLKNNSTEEIKKLKNTSSCFLFILLLDCGFYDIDPDVLVISCLIVALRYYFSSFLNSNNFTTLEVNQIFSFEKKLIKSILNSFNDIKHILKKQIKTIRAFLIGFQSGFKEFTSTNKLFSINPKFFV